ncbi:MAG: GNAT family acetyltransferase [Polaromonas sp.]
MKIRPYAMADESHVVALWQACGLTRPWNDPYKDIARKLSVRPEWFFVGEVKGVLIASAMFSYDGHRGWVNYLAVAPGHQGKGYARQLMTQGEAQLKLVGCPKLSLQIRSSNASVMAFYQHLGYDRDDVVSLGKRLIPDL